MPFEVLPMVIEDLQEAGTLATLAFDNDPALKIIYREMQPEFQLKRSVAQWDKPGARYYKCIDADTGRMAGYTRWLYPHQKDPANLTMAEYPPGATVDLWNEYFSAMDAGRAKNCDNETMFFVHILVVHPGYQRKGIGKMLMDQGLKDADAAGAKTYIEATDAGIGLYRKLGFVEFDKYTIDLTKYGHEGEGGDWFMIRQPRK